MNDRRKTKGGNGMKEKIQKKKFSLEYPYTDLTTIERENLEIKDICPNCGKKIKCMVAPRPRHLNYLLCGGIYWKCKCGFKAEIDLTGLSDKPEWHIGKRCVHC